MRLQVTVGKDLYQIEVDRSGDGFRVTVNGRPFDVSPAAGGFSVGGKTHAVEVRSREGQAFRAVLDGKPVEALILDVAKAEPRKAEGPAAWPAGPALKAGESTVVAPMPGKIVKVLVSVGQAVKAGQPACILEAMKMQNEVPVPAAGVVREVRVKEGQSVMASDVLVVLEGA